MIIQGNSSLLAAYGVAKSQTPTRQTTATPTANIAEKVTISEAARKQLGTSSSAELAVETRLNAIKARPVVERTEADTEYLFAHDARLAEIRAKDPQTHTSDDIDYMQKAGGFVNTMANLSAKEKALYDELVATGNTEAASAMNLIALTRQGMGSQQVTLPDGTSFDPTATEITADNIRNLFQYLIVDSDGTAGRQFEALAAYLQRKESTATA